MDSKAIDRAMREKLPVVAGDIRYRRIIEYILWYDAQDKRQTSVVLLDKNGHSTVRVASDRIELAGEEET